jgi:probable biosynthetic protein (TIGR04098 family)
MSEVAMLSFAQHIRWRDLGDLTGVPASGLRDAGDRPVYASIYFAEVAGFPAEGLGAFRPDEDLEVASTLGRFGRSVLDGEVAFHRAGTAAADLEAPASGSPRIRLSNVLVGVGSGPDDLRITVPQNARMENVPALDAEPDSYMMIKVARREGCFFPTPSGSRPLWPGARVVRYTVDPDRDMNGVGLVYFCNYVAFMDVAERTLLEAEGTYPPELLDWRLTVRRQVGFYGNARSREPLAIEVEASTLPGAGDRLVVHHRIRRTGDDRLIAVASAEKWLRPVPEVQPHGGTVG